MSLLKNKRVLIYLGIYTLCIFGSGVLTGNMIENDRKPHGHHWEERHDKRSEKLQSMLTKKLDLTTIQQTQLADIVKSHKEALKEMKDGVHGRFDAIRDAHMAEINAILTPSQKERFKKIQEKMKKKMKRHRN